MEELKQKENEVSTIVETREELKVKTPKKQLFNWKLDAPLLVILAVLLFLAGFGYKRFFYKTAESKKLIMTPTVSTEAESSDSSSEDPTTPSTPTSTSTNPATNTASPKTTTTPNSNTSSPSPTTTPTTPPNNNNDNTETNTQPIFTVSAVTASIDPAVTVVNPVQVIHFTGRITANMAGTVTYHWIASDGGIYGDQTITFPAVGGTQSVTNTWTLANPGQYWVRLVVTSPNSISSNNANFTISVIN